MSINVSVIVPIFNSEKYLRQCIESITSQKFENYEIILVNDGSTDKSLDICKEYRKKYSSIRIIDKVNGGVSSARNVGIKAARGECVTFIDSDDYIDSNMLNVLYTELMLGENDLVVCGFTVFKNTKYEKVVYKENRYIGKTEIANFFALMNGRTNSPCNKMYKKSLITQMFDEKIDIGEDLLFNLNYFKNCKSVGVLEIPFYFYRRENKNSLSQSFRRNLFYISELLYTELYSYLKESGVDFKSFTSINLFFYNNTLTYLTGVVNSEITFKEKIKSIKAVSDNMDLRMALSHLKFKSYNKKVLKFLLLKKWVFTLFLALKTKAKLNISNSYL